LDEEDIVRGGCDGSEIESTAFVVTFYGTNSSLFLYRVTLVQQDSSTTTVNVTDITPISTDGGYMGSNIVVAQTRRQYVFVSDGTNTFVFNWMLPCNKMSLLIQSAFTFISFFTTGSTYQCRCPISDSEFTSPAITTDPWPVTTTTPTTTRLTTTFSGPGDSRALDDYAIISIIISCIVAAFVVAVMIVLCIIIIVFSYYINKILGMLRR
jgi:hypothetical protein